MLFRIITTVCSAHPNLPTLCLVLGDENAARDQSTDEVHGGEVVLAANFLKTTYTIDSHSVLKHNNRGQHLDVQLADEEGALFCVDAHKARFEVNSANFLHVHVDNLASLEVLVEKGANHVVSLGHRGQEILLRDLLIGAVTQGYVRALFFVVHLRDRHALRCHEAHQLLFILVHREIGVLFSLRSLALLSSRIWLVESERIDLSLLGCHHFVLHHLSLVLDGLLEDHVSEQITS